MISRNSGRDPLIDALKGYAIFLVIWGHVLQCLGEGMDVLSNPLGKFIYLFHMPLFFFLSGYVSVGSLSRGFKDLFISRLRSLFIPMCIWAFMSWIVRIITGVQSILDWNFIGLAKSCFYEILGAYWFIWVLLYCIFFVKLILSINSVYKTPLLLGSILLVLLLPDIPFIKVDEFKCMYPFFVGGYLFSNYSLFAKIWKKLALMLIISGGVFLLCYLICKPSYFMYGLNLNIWSGTVSVQYIGLHLLFLIIAGYSGIILSYFGMRFFTSRFSSRYLIDIGRYTFAIYMLQGILFRGIFEAYLVDLHFQIVYFAVAVLITLVVWKIVSIISFSKSFSLLLLGK